MVDAWRTLRRKGPRQNPIENWSWIRRRGAELYHSKSSHLARAEALDLLDRVRGRGDALVPPRRLQFVGGGDFRSLGEEFRRHLIELGGLEPHHVVLDVGCGVGRMAVPLTGWLAGRYEGFDIVPAGIEWCRREVGSRYPNFRFQLADIRNTRYNPTGRYESHEYRFPYEDDSFDFSFATSVFSHLLPEGVENYLAELKRVLKPNGRCLATYFLLNEECQGLIDVNAFFPYDQGVYRVRRREVPEQAVAYEEAWIRELHERSGLPIERMYYGSWCGRDQATSYQDITVSIAGS